MAGHETLNSNRKISLGSNRNFGLVFCIAFLLVALWPAIRHAEGVRWWALGVSVIFLGLALFADAVLAPLNRLWFRLGMALHAIVSPIVMGLLFYCAVTPVAFALRLVGKDILRLSRSKTNSYWIERAPPGPAQGSMKQQF